MRQTRRAMIRTTARRDTARRHLRQPLGIAFYY
jgi:hypothetical protein